MLLGHRQDLGTAPGRQCDAARVLEVGDGVQEPGARAQGRRLAQRLGQRLRLQAVVVRRHLHREQPMVPEELERLVIGGRFDQDPVSRPRQDRAQQVQRRRRSRRQHHPAPLQLQTFLLRDPLPQEIDQRAVPLLRPILQCDRCPLPQDEVRCLPEAFRGKRRRVREPVHKGDGPRWAGCLNAGQWIIRLGHAPSNCRRAGSRISRPGTA